MKADFRIKRVLILVLIVFFLAFVYFMVRAGYSSRLDTVRNSNSTVVSNVERTYNENWGSGGYLVIEDPTDQISVDLRPAVELTLGAIGEAPVYTSSATPEEIAAASEGIIITATYLENVTSIYELLVYAENGGTLVFAVRPEVDSVFKSIYQQLGIYEHFYFKDSSGIHLRSGLITEEPFDVEEEWIYNSVIELHTTDECEVYAKNDDGVPMIWSKKHGQGNILFMNNSLMTYKSTGGLLLALLSEIKGEMMYPVVNARSFALEGFPLPNDVNRDYMKREYLRTGRAFLRDVWWPDMLRLSITHEIPYTAGILMMYESEDKLPTLEALLEDMNLSFYSRELSKYGGELAFTGANQKPLYFSEMDEQMSFETWTSDDYAKARTNDAIEYLDEAFPNYDFRVYIPPERVLDEDGYNIIKKSMKNLGVVCGDFYDEHRLYQDFGVREDGVVEYPVVTEGFDVGHRDVWDLLCTAAAKGVVFHSCDVTTILLESDPDRSWDIISRDFQKFFSDYVTQTNYLDGLTVTSASERVKDMLALSPEIEFKESSVSVKIENMPEKASFFLLTNGKTVQPVLGVTCTEVFENRYLIETTVSEFELEMR